MTKAEKRPLDIRIAEPEDLDAVLNVERFAFDQEDVAQLVDELLVDSSALPVLSLLAFTGSRAVGHILFTHAQLKETPERVNLAILAPLAVIPDVQKQGVGSQLVEYGLKQLESSGIDLVFVLGYPDYYLRFGFEPAIQLGLSAPYPIEQKNEGAWMVKALKPNLLGVVKGTVACAEAMDKPEHWRE